MSSQPPKYLIKQAQICNEGKSFYADVRLSGGRIEKIAPSLSLKADESEIIADGLTLLPGLIDDQVHFRDPGLTHKGDTASESAAAVAGGVTSFMEMPNVNPTTTDRGRLKDKYSKASTCSYANYAYYLGANTNNLDEIKALTHEEGCALKVFMGSSTGDMLVDDREQLDAIFREAPCMVVTHCEDTPMILQNEEAARAKYGEEVPFTEHPLIRSAEACYKSSSMAIELAKSYDARLHILHISTAKELELFEAGPLKNKRITSEACVHHLYYCDEDYPQLGSKIKCNPAIKSAADRQAVLQAVCEDRIDVIATDHAPHTSEEKAQTYFKAPSGLPLVQHSLLMMLEHLHEGKISLEKIVEKACHAPADLFSVIDRGYIREGYYADLVLVDMNAAQVVTQDSLFYACKWSPLQGSTLRSSIQKTFVNGHLAFDYKKLFAPHGQALQFDPGGWAR
jgi:dihydroorotase